jgi:hypothetical protein
MATVIDLASRRVVGWASADHLRTDLVAQALTNAVAARRPTGPVIFHSDRGCQGEFNRSSQHLDHGGGHGTAEGLDDEGHGQADDAFAGASAGLAA